MKSILNFKNRFRILKGGKISLVVSALLGGATLTYAAPSGGVLTSGSATISNIGKTTNIIQSTSKASINWQKFNIARDEVVNFKQPDVNSITLNRVIGNERSVINGALNANGQVWLLNSNGVLFGKNARINTAGLLASTKNLSDADFMAGEYNFKGDSTASVINLGEIDISDSGYATLLANSVTNEGTIRAIRGSVHLVGANEVSINLNGNSIVDLTIDKGVLDALVENKGAVYADGGEIYLTTNAVDELLKGVVNNTGIIEANSLDAITGYIELFAHGGEAQVGGTIEAKDGFVETSGKEFKVEDSFKIKAKEWLIDPTNITVESTGSTTDLTGSSIKASLIEDTLNGGTGVTLQADENIYVNEDIAWSQSNLFLKATSGNVNINSTLTASGTAGLSVTKGGDFNVAGKVDFIGTNNYLSIAGKTYNIITTSAGLQNMNNNLTLSYALGVDLDLNSITNWNPVGDYSTKFTGKFDGLGHTASNVNMEVSASHSGFFGAISEQSSIKNISLENINYTSDGNTYYGIGGLVGTSLGDISNVSVSGTMTILQSNKIGGLVGQNNGNIKNTYSNVNIKSDSITGGIVGIQYSGSVENSYALGDITSAYAGGLIGIMNTGTLKNSYASNAVSGTYSKGLISNTNTEITNSYYDKTKSTYMSDEATYGKTKAEITSAFSDKAGWSTGGGASVEGYEIVELPYLTNVTKDADKPATSILFAGGFGTQTDAYTITNWTQLQNINNSNILTQNYYFSLLNDLSSATSDYTNLAGTTANSGKGWNPIGDAWPNDSFRGSFDGQNNSISNLYIKRSSEDKVGLFGQTGVAHISNIKLLDVEIEGKNDVGGLIGNNANGTLSNIEVTGNVSGSENVGGLVGVLDATLDDSSFNGDVTSSGGGDYTGGLAGLARGDITNSNSSGSVTGDKYVGGLAGKNARTITNSFSTSSVIGLQNVGGLVGTNDLGEITLSYSTGEVKGSNFIGGLVGHNTSGEGAGNINKSYSTGKVIGVGDVVGGLVGMNEGIIINSYSLGDTKGNEAVGGLVGFNDEYGTIENSYTSSKVEGTNSDYTGGLVGFNDGNNPTNSFYDNEMNTATMNDSTDYGNSKAQITSVFSDKTSWSTGGGATVEGYEIVELPYLTNVTKDADKPATSILFAGGFGTQTDAYTITNWTQLQNINNSNILTQNYYFSLLNDLSSSTSDYATLASATANNNKGWNPIGNLGNNNIDYFTGHFDGQEKTIDSLVVNTSESAGLFRRIKDATILNLGVTNADVATTGSRHLAGILVAYQVGGTIINTYTTGEVDGVNDVGGVVGRNKDGIIKNSYSTAKVTATADYVGGLVGVNDAGTIENSYATGKVEADNNVGGLVGFHGYAGDIKNSYASGEVVANDGSHVGGLVGNNSHADIYNSFFDKETTKQTIGVGYSTTSQDSASGKTTSDMKKATTFDGWSIEEDSTIDANTPFLAWQTNGNSYTKTWVIGTKRNTPEPKPKPEIEQETREAQKVIIAIVNDEAVKVKVPTVQAKTSPLQSGKNTNITFQVGGENKALVSKPIEGQTTRRVSLSEAREMQVEAGVDSSEVRVPLSRDSIIQLVDGGVSLPNGVEQEFYMADEI